jgi:hypothetical protein
MTAHVSPYRDGLAPETRVFVGAMNVEAEHRDLGVKFIAFANRIEARGAIQSAAATDTLSGWFIRDAIRNGFLQGEETVFRRGNSEHRKHLRKRAKTKAGYAEQAARRQAVRDRDATRRIAEAGDAFIGASAVVPGSWPKAWINGVYMPILHPPRPRGRKG